MECVTPMTGAVLRGSDSFINIHSYFTSKDPGLPGSLLKPSPKDIKTSFLYYFDTILYIFVFWPDKKNIILMTITNVAHYMTQN